MTFNFVVRELSCCPPQGRELLLQIRCDGSRLVRCCPPQGRELLPKTQRELWRKVDLLSPAGARVVTTFRNQHDIR